MTSSPRFALSLVMGFTTLLAACGGGGGGEGSVFGRSRSTGTVAVVLASGETPMGREIVTGMEASAKEHGLTLAVSTSGRDPGREQAAVAKAIQDRAAALVVESVDSVSAAGSAEAAARAKVPYFALGVPAPGPTAAHVDVDHYAAGRVAAEYLAGYLGGKGVLALVRAPGAHGTRELEQGFRDGVAAHKGLSVVAVVDAGDQAAAAAGMMQLLRAQRGVKGVFAAGPELAQGATEGAIAVRRADLAIVSFEMSDVVRAAVANAQEAPIKASVIARPREMGKAMIDAVALQLADEPVAAQVRVPVRLITADSATKVP